MVKLTETKQNVGNKGLGEGKMKSDFLMGPDFSLRDAIKVLKMNNGNGCTRMWI